MQIVPLFALAALPLLVSASPAERRSSSSSKRANVDLMKRNGEDQGCTFDGKIGNSYINNPVGDGDGKSCFGFPNGGAVTCGGPWSADEINNIKKAVKEQVTKDGQFKTSEAGEWTAGFSLFTTAFDDRDTSAFDKTLDAINVEGNSGAGQMTYWWQRSNDYLSVTRDGCGGSLLDDIFGK
ncbi:MAG: hypothetical protein Q9172_001515 [Xanthocarpia lactea]